MDEQLKTKTELLIFIRILQIQLGLVVITVLINFIVGFKNQIIDDFYQAITEMAVMTILLLVILFFRLQNVEIKKLRIFIVFLIPFVALYHLWLYLLNVLQIEHPSILDKLFSLQSEIFNFFVFTYTIFCFINLLWIINQANLSKRHLIIMDYFTLA